MFFILVVSNINLSSYIARECRFKARSEVFYLKNIFINFYHKNVCVIVIRKLKKQNNYELLNLQLTNTLSSL